LEYGLVSCLQNTNDDTSAAFSASCSCILARPGQVGTSITRALGRLFGNRDQQTDWVPSLLGASGTRGGEPHSLCPRWVRGRTAGDKGWGGLIEAKTRKNHVAMMPLCLSSSQPLPNLLDVLSVRAGIVIIVVIICALVLVHPSTSTIPPTR